MTPTEPAAAPAAGVSDHKQAESGPDQAAVPVNRRPLLKASVAGLLLAASFPPYYLPVLMPLGIALLLSSLPGATLRQAFYRGLVCGLFFFGATIFWLFKVFGPPAISLIAIAAAFIAVFTRTFAWSSVRWPRAPGWLLAAVVWVAVEYFRSEPFPLSFGWMGLGYGTSGSYLCSMLAPIVGCYGISFLIVLAGYAINRRPFSYGVAAAALWCAAILMPAASPAPHRPVQVRLVQADSAEEDTFFELSKSKPGSRADFIVWPEYSYAVDPRRDRQTWPRLQSLAREEKCVFIFGGEDQFDRADANQFRNTAFVLGPDGAQLGTHVKNHLVHFYQDGQPGKEAKAINTPKGPIGVAICFDMDYPDIARRLAADGAQIFLVPNDDPKEWLDVQRMQHRLMFQMRAAECDKWLARADVSGGTSVVAPSGRETARVNTREPAVLNEAVELRSGQTLFVQGGWRFGQLCLVVTASVLLRGLWPVSRSPHPAQSAQ